MKFLG